VVNGITIDSEVPTITLLISRSTDSVIEIELCQCVYSEMCVYVTM